MGLNNCQHYFGAPCYDYSMMGPKTLSSLSSRRPLHLEIYSLLTFITSPVVSDLDNRNCFGLVEKAPLTASLAPERSNLC